MGQQRFASAFERGGVRVLDEDGRVDMDELSVLNLPVRPCSRSISTNAVA